MGNGATEVQYGYPSHEEAHIAYLRNQFGGRGRNGAIQVTGVRVAVWA